MKLHHRIEWGSGWALRLSAAVLVAASSGPLQAQDALQGWRADSATKSLILERVEEHGPGTYFFLRNTSEKTITAMVVAFGTAREPVTEGVDCFDAEASCTKPGGLERLTELTSSLPRLGPRVVHVLAVVFEDGSSEGEQASADYVNMGRLGEMFETERLRGILSNQLDLYLGEAGLRRLTEEIGKPPESPENAFASLQGVVVPGVSAEAFGRAASGARFSFFAGVTRERRYILQQIGELRNLPASAPPGADTRTQAAALEQLRQHYEAASDKYRAYCQLTHGGLR